MAGASPAGGMRRLLLAGLLLCSLALPLAAARPSGQELDPSVPLLQPGSSLRRLLGSVAGKPAAAVTPAAAVGTAAPAQAVPVSAAVPLAAGQAQGKPADWITLPTPGAAKPGPKVDKPAPVPAPIKPAVPAVPTKPVVPPAAKPGVPPATTAKPVVPPVAAAKPAVPPAATAKPAVPPVAAAKPAVPPAATAKPVVPPAAAVAVPVKQLPADPADADALLAAVPAAGLGNTSALAAPAGLRQRMDIAEISALADTNPYKVLMLLAWIEFTNSGDDRSDPLSYYSLAGVHGQSWSYDGVRPSGRGFCKHGVSSFGPWHRPYIARFEQGLQRAAQTVVNRMTPRLKAVYQPIVASIALPYWDWTSDSTPELLTTGSVTVIDPATGDITSDSNPLRRYEYPRSTGSRSGGTHRASRWAASMERNSYSYSRQMGSFVRSQNWGCTFAGGSRCSGNLENTHNSIHSTLGSGGGEMNTIAYAAFDPIFWLHHAQIDRCLWLFQNNGGHWREASSYRPFAPDNAANLAGSGYTYREAFRGDPGRRRLLAANPNALPSEVPAPTSGSVMGSATSLAAVKRALSQWSDGYEGYGWQVQFANVTRLQDDEVADVFVFVRDAPDAPRFPSRRRIIANDLRMRKDYCGGVTGWSDTRMAKGVSAPVDITNCLRAAGIDPAVKPKDPTNLLAGPEKPAITLDGLRFVALTPQGRDVSGSFRFGRAAISWTLPVTVKAPGAPGSVAGVDTPELFGQEMGFF